MATFTERTYITTLESKYVKLIYIGSFYLAYIYYRQPAYVQLYGTYGAVKAAKATYVRTRMSVCTLYVLATPSIPTYVCTHVCMYICLS